MKKEEIIIKSCFKNYSVEIVDSLSFLRALVSEDNTEIVIDRNVYSIYREYFKDVNENALFIVEATEDNKVIETALRICEKMTELSAKRNAHIVSIGGGIVQDITGFVASILYRGIKWTFIPTTLLAACDSCIGGKTSLNYKRYKNLIGTFYPPDRIIVCSAFFQTLTQKDFESGLGEVVKFNIMAGDSGLSHIEESIGLLLSRDEPTLDRCVKNSLMFKRAFIEVDEFDKRERIKLNFAHTFGHGIEMITDYAIPHGTAVAIGMILANNVSVARKLLDANYAERCEKVLLKVIHIETDFHEIPMELFLKAIRKDKKQIDDRITAVIMVENGKELRIVHDVKEREIVEAVDHFCKVYYSDVNFL